MLLLKSNILRERIIKEYNLLPVLFSKQWDEEKKTWKKGGGFSLNPLTWISKLIAAVKPADKKAIKKEPGVPDMWDGLRALDGAVKINNNIKEKSITISIQFDDPVIATNIANYFIATLNNHMSSEAKRVAAINKKYLEEQLLLNSDPLIKQKIYTMIAQQVETAMMAEVKENFSFKVIDPPMVPDKKIKPKRAQMVVLSFVVSLFLAVFVVFALEYLEKNNILKGKRFK
jgi:capsular polysaccharide biosynthesis protein